MSQRLCLTLVLPALACLSISCQGPAEGLSSVSGKVLCNGEPASGAVLLFHRQAGGDSAAAGVAHVIPTAIVQDDGSFTVESPPLGYGALPGSYAVLAQWPKEQGLDQDRATDRTKTISNRGKTVIVSKHNKLDPVAPDRLKGRYMDMSKPFLQTEVKPGSNDLGTLEFSLNN
jgi:hypothetical protein